MKSVRINRYDKTKNGQEMGFYAEVSSSKEIIFKELQLPAGAKADARNYLMKEALNFNKKLKQYFCNGHIHTEGWYRNAIPLSQKSISDFNYGGTSTRNIVERYSNPSENDQTVDYSSRLNRVTPLIIGSPLGISIYSSTRIFNTNNVVSYKWFNKKLG